MLTKRTFPPRRSLLGYKSISRLGIIRANKRVQADKTIRHSYQQWYFRLDGSISSPILQANKVVQACVVSQIRNLAQPRTALTNGLGSDLQGNNASPFPKENSFGRNPFVMRVRRAKLSVRWGPAHDFSVNYVYAFQPDKTKDTDAIRCETWSWLRVQLEGKLYFRFCY